MANATYLSMQVVTQVQILGWLNLTVLPVCYSFKIYATAVLHLMLFHRYSIANLLTCFSIIRLVQ